MLRIFFGLILIFFSPIVKGQTDEDWGKYAYQTMPSGTSFFPSSSPLERFIFVLKKSPQG